MRLSAQTLYGDADRLLVRFFFHTIILFCLPTLIASAEAPRLRRGIDKEMAIVALQGSGVRQVSLGVYPQISVSRASDLDAFANVEGIILGAGDIRIAFNGNSVSNISVAPIYPEYSAALAGASSRQDVLAALALLLKEDGDLTFKSCAAANHWVSLNAPTEEDRKLLYHYDRWSGSYENSAGYWHVTVTFVAGRVANLDHDWSPAPK